MDFNTSFPPPNIFSGFSATGSEDSLDEFYDASDRFRVFDNFTDAQREIHLTDSHPDASVTDNRLHPPDDRHSQVIPQAVDLAERVKGMYRLLALIGESGSNGYVDKVVIAQESLQRFVNAMSPGAYASLTKVDFKTLDRLLIKPLGVYGSKDEIVRLLTCIGAIDEKEAHLFLASSDVMGTNPTLSSGLYIVRARTTDPVDERHYVIYWPEKSTWNDSATSSTSRNRVTFMRYLTKMCDQVVALLSPEQSASLVWNDQESDTESVDMDIGDSDRLYTFEVAKTNEQEQSAVARPGFKMKFAIISGYGALPNCPVDICGRTPRLLSGETSQGVLNATYIPHRTRSEVFDRQAFSWTSLKQLLTRSAFVLSETLEDPSVRTLSTIAISDLFPGLYKEWTALKRDIRDVFWRESLRRQSVVLRDIASKENSLRNVLHEAVVEDVVALFPSIDRTRLGSRASSHGQLRASEVAANSMTLGGLELLYSGSQEIYHKHVQDARFYTLLKRDYWFEARKLRLISVQDLYSRYQHLSRETRTEVIRTILMGDFDRAQHILLKEDRKKRSHFKFFSETFGFLQSGSGRSRTDVSLKEAMKILAARTPDPQFLLHIMNMEDTGVDTQSLIREVQDFAHATLASSIDTTVEAMTRALLAKQQEICKQSVEDEINSEEKKALRDALTEYIQIINSRSAERGDSVVYIDNIRDKAGLYDYEYIVTGRQETLQRPLLQFWIHPMDLTADDKHSMQLDTKHIPTPTVNDPLSSTFLLPVGVDIAFCQILENEKLLLVLVNRDNVSIYLDRFPAMEMAVRGKSIKLLNREKLGEDVLFAFDETKRVLVVCSSVKLQLHVFVFDETFKTLQGQGSAINLAPWYGQPGISIIHAAFVCGSEEVVLIDSSAQARIFSFITLQFRPASLQLPSLPTAIFSSPDGSCLLVLHTQDSQPSLTAYHWETFGSTQGIPLDFPVPDFPLQDAVLTSMVSRGRVFLVGLDIDTGTIQSIAIDITKKVTEFMFKEKGIKDTSDSAKRQTIHNVLLDCHAEVWTRFPVVPAVKRRTVTSLSERQQKRLTFVSEQYTRPFDSYFSDLIQTFQRTTRKPTGDELRRIKVSATDFGSFRDEVILNPEWEVSRYRVGEWLVDLLCLIPIHIAVCRENRFIPLANGVLSAELERSLLGASVNKIVDKLSFGWYESIFQSYLATKPVKVVTSMGQQSVGKSFSLNHLLDTSFAGSAMRTTEGVWMSVTPTDDALIVALDFEGVDSVERSLQEDTLLVLFNTAISNLVLFRNNFAFSRDISGLFQSFQSSASVLDPAANPTLFQSTLVIIIKDVVESDQREISREFSLKFQKIVQQEQDANFISRLHGGKLDIIPWPVIESKEFYKLFATLKKRLDVQKNSHPAAGEFLHTIKTLMAKLKANDWGALSQTMIEHRVRTLSALLTVALATGYSEIEPDLEPLKNLDTDLIVESDDTPSRFALSQHEYIPSEDIETHLSILRESWNQSTPRQSIPDPDWIKGLAEHINGLIILRVSHVRLWLDSNLERFPAGHAAIEDLRRCFDNMVIEMRANVQLCSGQCASCHLLCVRGRLHDGEHSCRTTHKCVHNCVFCADNLKPCGTPAGHPGEHVCVVNAHLCGEPCNLSGKRGCLEDCTKVAGHEEDEHMCSAPLHMCGEPCSLRGITLPGGKTYSCPERCSIPNGQEHDTHSCDTRLCPTTCDLCKRLCIQPHLHGLIHGMHHLCGEAHSCSALCSAPGICQIDTAPQSVEATFTGRHDTFQYTKYTQVAKRLQCVKTIEPGETSHTGAHIHSKEDQPFHFCETRCENCGYFCILPLGHTQQEHETSHGSMTHSRWAVYGPEESAIELGGRKFSSEDDGAPMMCNLVCSSMGRHIHIDYCRAEDDAPCEGPEVQHINARMTPNPGRPKDAVTHGLYWRRMGFKDPYTRDEQISFAKCDAMCSGPEHSTTAPTPGQPSYCTLPMFHPPKSINDPVNGPGYISSDGHTFECRTPVGMEQAFHVIFVIDRSSSMSVADRQPLENAPASDRIRQHANNRLGAVYSALYSFWTARHAALTAGQQAVGARRDAYSIIFFDSSTHNLLVNDLEKTPEQLLDTVLRVQTSHGTNFTAALRASQSVMTQHWSMERTPVIIFLSDGGCQISDVVIQEVCASAVRRGRPLSFHSVSFGRRSNSVLRRMAQVALEIQNNAPLRPEAANVPSSFNTALDTVRLAETFLGIAESLRKPRGALMR